MKGAGKIVELAGKGLACGILVFAQLSWSGACSEHGFPLGAVALALMLVGRELKARR